VAGQVMISAYMEPVPTPTTTHSLSEKTVLRPGSTSSHLDDATPEEDESFVDPDTQSPGTQAWTHERMQQFPAQLPRIPDEPGTDMQPDRNKIDLERIERGLDTRTTVMIKNIPNKMTDRHLINFINAVCPRKIDFLYLRMDFMTGWNVGYAFVNFIQVKDLLHFARMKLGKKWNLFTSEKLLGMNYANYQGKDALISKFRSSSIMAQRESWRPKIFHSSGPRKGLPQEFPGPEHVHHNRLNLYTNPLL